MTYEDLFVAIATEAPNMTGSALKLLLHLVGRAIEQGTSAIHVSNRSLSDRAGIAKSQLPEAKRTLAAFFPIESRQGATSTFNLPAGWFPPQRLLFSTATGPETRPVLDRKPGQYWTGNQTSAGPETGPTGPETGPLWTGNRPTLDRKPAHSGPETGPTGPETGPAATQNQQDTDALSRSRSISEVGKDCREYVLSILSMRVLPAEKRGDATVLASELQHSMHQLGNTFVAENLPDDVVLSQCLAIAPLRELLPALKLAKQRRGRPRGYAWFVTVFLENIHGIPRETTLAIRDELRSMRQRKEPGRAEPLPFPDQLVREAVNQVRKLR